MGLQNDLCNCFRKASNAELRIYYQQYKEFQKTGSLPEEYELRKIANMYIEVISGAWIVPFTTDLLETIADRWMLTTEATEDK